MRDLTTGESLYTARARGLAERIGLAEVGAYSSAEGIPVYRDHEYELVSVYDNTSGVDQREGSSVSAKRLGAGAVLPSVPKPCGRSSALRFKPRLVVLAGSRERSACRSLGADGDALPVSSSQRELVGQPAVEARQIVLVRVDGPRQRLR